MNVLGKPVDVVAWFDKMGMPRPVRIRITNEDESETVISIDKIIHTNKERLAGNPMPLFRCQGKVNGVEKVYQGLRTNIFLNLIP